MIHNVHGECEKSFYVYPRSSSLFDDNLIINPPLKSSMLRAIRLAAPLLLE